MSRKIIGVTVGSPLPKPNLMQNDPTKGDYIKGKEEFLEQAGGDIPVVDNLPPVTDDAPGVVYLKDDETDGDKIQNVENAGKLLYVGPDGLVQTLVLGSGLRIVNGVLSITGTITPEETTVLFMDNGDSSATVQGVVFEDMGGGVVLMRGYNMEVEE